MDRFVIGTAGHVDHGKTTLVRALTGVSTDRLPEEKRRGISIELGFARWAVAPDVDASIIDVPGHRRLVHAMIAGASGIELVMLVVAADEGVMPQTREHVAACELLGLRDAVVALTKADRVDGETLTLAGEEIAELLGSRWRHVVVPCVATDPGHSGLEVLRGETERALRAVRARDREQDHRGPRLWIDRVFQVRGAGTVVTGTLLGGAVQRGERLVLVGARGAQEVVARELHVHGENVARADAPTRLAINLTIDAAEIARGDLVTVAAAAPEPTSTLDVAFRGDVPRRGASCTLHVGTSHVAADVVRTSELGGGEHVLRLVLREPRPVSGGDRYLLRGSKTTASRGALLGGGVILDARPPARARRATREALLVAVRDDDPGAVLAALLAETSPRSLDVEGATLRARLPMSVRALKRAAEASLARSELVRCEAGLVARDVVTSLATDARALVAEHVAQSPLDRGLSLATLRQRLSARAGADVAEAAILAARARRGPHDLEAIAIEGDTAVMAVRRGRLDPELAAAVARAGDLIERAGVHGMSLGHLVELAAWTEPFGRAVVAAVERSGRATRAGDLWFASTLVASVRDRTLEHLGQAERVTVIELKALCGLPRRQAILLLEHFDAVGLTRRAGDARVLGAAR